MVSIKFLLRTAVRLQQVWEAKTTHAFRNWQNVLDRLSTVQRKLQHAQRIYDKARAHGWSSIGSQLQTKVLSLVIAVEKAAREAHACLEQSASIVPSLPFLVAELRQIDADFIKFQIDARERYVSATTEPITLRDVNLGPFAIQFSWERLHQHPDAQCFDIIALDPNPAAADSRVTHPHVKSKKLCVGDAKAALGKALEQGRLADAFCLIRSVLANYNVNSPHVRLDEWGGTTCHDCDRSVNDEDCLRCENCGHNFCPDCSSSCAVCGNIRCLSCLKDCALCDDVCCGHCLQVSAHSRRECCRDCMRTCPSCGAQVAKDELSASSDGCPARHVPETSCENGDRPTGTGPVSTSTFENLSLEHDHAETLEHVAPAIA